VATVVLLFVAGLLASMGGRVTRRGQGRGPREADVLQVLTAVNLAAARSGIKADTVAVAGLLDLLGARAVQVVRQGPRATWWSPRPAGSTAASTSDDLPHLDEEGRIPSGHRRAVSGTLVLPAQGAVIDLVRRGHRVGALVILPDEDKPILRTTRMAIAATAHALANAR
jgi:hypothetical protein